MSHPRLKRLLLTNDDGIDAPGLAALEQAAATLAQEVWVVAPLHDQSGQSHALSVLRPLQIHPRGERRFAVNGTPGDCATIGIRHLMADNPPDLILSGINHGMNLGVETVFSGTVGGAMTGMLLGVRAMALSLQFTFGHPVRWDTARTLTPRIVHELLDIGWDLRTCLNVNIPDRPVEDIGPLTLTRQGPGRLETIDVVPAPHDIPDQPLQYQLKFRRTRAELPPDSDTATLLNGAISVTPLYYDRTDDAAYQQLSKHMRRAG